MARQSSNESTTTPHPASSGHPQASEPPSWTEIGRGVLRNIKWGDFFLKLLGALIVSTLLNCYFNDISFNDFLWANGLRSDRDAVACSNDSIFGSSAGHPAGAVESFREGCRALSHKVVLDDERGRKLRDLFEGACEVFGGKESKAMTGEETRL